MNSDFRWEIEQFVGGKRKTELDVPLRGDVLKDRPNVELYDTMLLDPGISFPLHLLKLPIARSRLVYTNPNSDIQKFIAKELDELRPTIQSNALTALEHGFSAFERRFEVKNGEYHYKEYVHLNPRYIWIKINKQTKGFDGIEQKYKGKTVTLKPEKSYIFAHESYFSNLYGKSQIGYAYVPWLLDKEFYRYHGLALQEFGLQTLVGRAPEGNREVDMGEAGKQEISNLEFIKLIGEAVRSRTVVTYPSGEGWDLGALFSRAQSVWDFNKDHDFLDMKKALAILIPPELWRAGGGSYAKARVQSFWFEQTIGSILDELTRSVSRHIIKPIIKLNFWDGREEPPYGELHGEPPSLEYQQFVEKLILAQQNKENVNWPALFKLMRIPTIEGEEGEFGLSSIPLDAKTLEEFCRKAFNKGISIGKEELAYTGFVPVPDEKKSGLREEAQKLQWLAKQSGNPMRAFVTVLSRLRAEGRETAHEYFCATVKEGGYKRLTEGRSNVA